MKNLKEEDEESSGNSRKRKAKWDDLKSEEEELKSESGKLSGRTIELGNGSEVVYYPSFLDYEEAWRFFHYLNNHIPWTRPTLRVFNRSCVQPRDSCYVASEGVQKLVYSGYQPHAYSWDKFPPLNQLLSKVEAAIPGSRFNSLLLNRYNGGNDYVGWHSDDEPLYGPTPQIASLSFGCDRHFFLKKKMAKNNNESAGHKKQPQPHSHSLLLKHGSMLLMRGYTQRDWIHSVPKRAKLDTVRINLTFRLVL